MTTREKAIEAWKNFDHDTAEKMTPMENLGMAMTEERCDEDGPWELKREIYEREWEVTFIRAELEILRQIEKEEGAIASDSARKEG